MRKPERTYRSLSDFTAAYRGWSNHKWPCLKCYGRGWDNDPTETPDPVEGYKHCRQVTCPDCQGTGEGTERECRAAYKRWQAQYQADCATWQAFIKLRKEALKKLTTAEINALRELGV